MHAANQVADVVNMYQKLKSYLEQVSRDEIPENRKAVLLELRKYIAQIRAAAEPVRLNFICTHNSRRSHLSMIMAAVAAAYYDVKVETLSGGTEATAFNSRAVRAIEDAGFKVVNPGGENPAYEVYLSDESKPLICFSKRFDDPANGTSPYAAVMTCSHADENCPFIPEADARIPVRYEDPKAFDDTPEESKAYAERCRQIASEMMWVFGGVDH